MNSQVDADNRTEEQQTSGRDGRIGRHVQGMGEEVSSPPPPTKHIAFLNSNTKHPDTNIALKCKNKLIAVPLEFLTIE